MVKLKELVEHLSEEDRFSSTFCLPTIESLTASPSV